MGVRTGTNLPNVLKVAGFQKEEIMATITNPMEHVLGDNALAHRYEFVLGALIDKGSHAITLEQVADTGDYYIHLHTPKGGGVAVWLPSNEFIAKVRRSNPGWNPKWVVAAGSVYQTLPCAALFFEVATLALNFAGRLNDA